MTSLLTLSSPVTVRVEPSGVDSSSLSSSSSSLSSSSSSTLLPDLDLLSRPVFSPEQLHALASHVNNQSHDSSNDQQPGAQHRSQSQESEGEGEGGGGDGSVVVQSSSFPYYTVDPSSSVTSSITSSSFLHLQPVTGPSSGLPPYPTQPAGHVSLPARALDPSSSSSSSSSSSPSSSHRAAPDPSFSFLESTPVAVQSAPRRSLFMNETLRERLMFHQQLNNDRLQPQGHTHPHPLHTPAPLTCCAPVDG
jgi:hypothetical protein